MIKIIATSDWHLGNLFHGNDRLVISHTDTMSERITTQIRIIKNGNSGSSYIKIGQDWNL